MDVCFQFLVMMNKGAINIYVQIFVWTYSVGGQVGRSYGTDTFPFLDTAKLFSKVVISALSNLLNKILCCREDRYHFFFFFNMRKLRPEGL